MKKMLIFILVAICILTMVSCDNESLNPTEVQQTEPRPTVDPHLGYPIPPQPIHFESIESAMQFIKAPKLEEYPEEFWSAYEYMCSVFSEDGFVYALSSNTIDLQITDISLYPEVKYEDAGIRYWVKYNDQSYNVRIYHTRKSLTPDAQDGWTSMEEYYKAAHSAIPDRKTYDHNGIDYITFTESTDSGYTNTYGLVDSSHYIRIRTQASYEELIAFIKQISTYKIDIP